MLKWFDAHPGVYWMIFYAVVVAYLFVLLKPCLLRKFSHNTRPDWAWGLMIAAVLAAGRWQSWFITRHLNDDESFLLSGTFTLRFDPVFWRSVDGGTSGPLNFYALMPFGSIVGSDNYLSARLTAWLLLSLGILFTYQALVRIGGREIARFSIFPALIAESASVHPDLLHYSSELVSMAIISAAFYLFVSRFVGALSARWNWFGAGLLGAIPFAKIQAIPIAAIVGLCWITAEFLWTPNPETRFRRITALIAGAVLPAVAVLALVKTWGLWTYFSTSYVYLNLAYAQANLFSLHNTLTWIWKLEESNASLLIQFYIAAALLLICTAPLARARDSIRTLVCWIAFLYLLASVFSVLSPHRPYLHYWQFCLLPLTLFLGLTITLITDAIETQINLKVSLLLVSTLFICVEPMILSRLPQNNVPANRLDYYQQNPSGPVSQVIQKFADRGEALGSWGWMSNFNVESKLRQATRRLTNASEIDDSPVQSLYRNWYMADLRRSEPPVFVDATGPGNFGFGSTKFSFEYVFPELREFVHDHYVLYGEVENSRIYIRKDRWAARVALNPKR